MDTPIRREARMFLWWPEDKKENSVFYSTEIAALEMTYQRGGHVQRVDVVEELEEGEDGND